MSKSSTATAREAPMERVASASAGGLAVHGETLSVETSERIQIIDLTDRIGEVVRGLGIGEGVINLWSLHTTCALVINEYQKALLADIERFLEQIVARHGEWMHNDPAHSDCDRMNADSHLRTMLLGHGLTLQISGGDLVLGQWQRILLAELDGPRTRSLRMQVWGIG